MPRRTAPSDEPSQTARQRVSSSTSIVNFAPPPLASRRTSWTAASAMPDLSARRPSWTPTLEGSGISMNAKGKQRMYSPPREEEAGSGSGDGSGSLSGSGSDSLLGRNERREGGEGGGGESSEDANTLRKVLEISMKGLVGDAVGNMSISPTSRDVVLAARKGLFIIDLESPLSVPRFLPQGGTWDVADVQWNPHASRAEYIVSTSAEKLLIWNLHLSSPASAHTTGRAAAQNPSAIQHVLHAHYRAITDINWHPAPEERDIVVSTGVDSWVWAWDLRAARGGRAVFGLSAFNSGGTQVKWNRQHPHVLASSHAGEVLIWDRRHGSLPTARLRAHRSKIYGIDWSPTDAGGLVTCALDGDIKVWNVGALGGETGERSGLYGAHPVGTDAWACPACGPTHSHSAHAFQFHDGLSHSHSHSGTDLGGYHSGSTHTHTPVRTIHTANPVWRARHLPFGRGLLSLPQRGETGLGMYALGNWVGGERGHTEREGEREAGDGDRDEREREDREWGGADGDEPVEVFEGHTDVVKEFVWRRGADGATFQLITWSKDRTLRFWPVELEMMQKVGYVRPPEPLPSAVPSTPTFSFRNPPPPPPDALVGEETQSLPSPALPLLSAPIGARNVLAGVRVGMPHANAKQGPAQGRGRDDRGASERPPAGEQLFQRARTIPVGSTRMSRGKAGGRRVGMDALTWLSNVKEVAGAGTGGDASGLLPRSSSGGRGAGSSGGGSEVEPGESLVRRRSDSRGRALLEEGQSLQDELTSVINKLVAAKIKLEKHDLTKKRTCTLGLHGPWGESSSVFIRITFTFPKDYPQGLHPRGTPTVELERNPLISLKNRAFILRRLRALRERQRPCLEACLRFLSEGEKSGGPHPMDSESSSDDEEHVSRKSRDFTVSLLRSHKNLAEPRTSQGTFGPNGELVCFFRAPPRIVRHVLRDLSISASPAKTVSDIPATHDSVDMSAEHPPPRVFRSPALLADAVRRLSLAATDRVVKPLDPRRPQDGDHILRIMTNLLTFSHDTSHHRDSESSRLRGEEGFRSDSFAFPAPRRSTVFITNTTDISGGDRKVAVGYVFEAETVAVLCQKNAEVAREHGRYDHERIFKILLALFPALEDFSAGPNMLVVKMVTRLHSELCRMKDIQMLAMLSMIVLQGCRIGSNVYTKSPEVRRTPTPKSGPVDYFSISRSTSVGNTGRLSPISPTWPRLTASPPLASNQPTLSTSNSSRGSWSSLFNAGSMRQFMSGVQDSLKDGLITPSDTAAPISIPVSKSDRIHRGPDSPLPRRRGYWRESGLPSPSAVSKSWHETSSPGAKHTVSFSSAGHRRPPFSQFTTSTDAIHETRVVVYDLPVEQTSDVFPAMTIVEFLSHIHIYADVLFSWQLFHKRLELLKSVKYPDTVGDSTQHRIGLLRSCPHCHHIVEQDRNSCPNCSRPCGMPHCTVCRLPVKGLSRSCLRCFHVTHILCWRRLDVPICPSGCGCLCFASLPPQSVPINASRMSSKGAP
ncbi:hypothetical protein B0H11DRAFT_784912 [Mycena galericulata]|nr:hypothetical protein B0H11DRAFT_784912 [Mycena galericulata]